MGSQRVKHRAKPALVQCFDQQLVILTLDPVLLLSITDCMWRGENGVLSRCAAR